jgi:glycerophosphoryl diester phosphodiesterase
MNLWNDLPRPLVIAHRGDRAFAPENTLTAFRQAVEKGAEAIEFDVKLTADGQVVVLHDQTVDRTTDGKGDISQLTLAQAREFDANVQFPDRFPAEHIPTLEEVFETVGHSLLMNIELTNYATRSDSLVPRVVELVKAHAIQERVLFSSFLARNLRKTSALLPDTPCGLLTLKGLLGLEGRLLGWRKGVQALHPYYTDVSPGLMDRLHAAGKRVNTWTVNGEKDIKNMISLGVDGIITDDPSLVLHLLGRSK